MKTSIFGTIPFTNVMLAFALLSLASLSAPAQTLCVDTNEVKYLQPPNPTGFDLLNSGPWVLADDFICTNTGPISDIHIWGSWLNDNHGTITNFWLGIYDDVPVSANNPNSHPGNLLWSQSFPMGQFAESSVGPSQEQFLDPGPGAVIGSDTNIWYYCFYPTTPFIQTGSTTAPVTYWLAAYAQVSTVVGSGPPPQYGWKTTFGVQNDTSVHEPWPGSLPGTNSNWLPTAYQPPAGGQVLLDLAFELETPANQTPPPGCCPDTNGVKWVQRPDLISGIDYLASGGFTLADDFQCTNSGPITDIHLWGSWLSDQVDLGATYTLAIWSDTPTNVDIPNSHPGNLLWSQVFFPKPPGNYTICPYTNAVEPFNPGGTPSGESTNLYYLCFFPDLASAFTQTGTQNTPTNYWLSLTVQTSVPTAPIYFGWKSSSDHYNDKAVLSTAAFPPPSGTWVPLGGQSHPDLAFKITTATNTPPVICVDSNDAVKYVQGPNLNGGYDVLDSAFTLADDFVCTNSGPITDIHLWGSFYNDLAFTNTINFWLGIFDDVPVGPGNTYSHPGTNLLWQQWFAPGQYAETFWGVGQEFFFDLNLMSTSPESNVWYYCFNPTNPFVQLGTAAAPKTYWLAAFAEFGSVIGNNLNRFGWKTTTNILNDISVHTGWAGYIPTNNPVWTQTLLPTGAPLDLAFMLTTPTNCCPVSITNITTNTVVIKWACGVLQSSTNVSGPYVNVPGPPTSPYTNTSAYAPPNVFYRTQCN